MANSVENVYAQALFELCCEDKCAEAVFDELGTGKEIIFSDENQSYIELLASPLIAAADKENALKSVFEGKISDLTLDFLRLLSEKERIKFLPGIYNEFKEMYYKMSNILEVTAVTSRSLSERLKDKLVNKLETVSGKKIILSEKTDESILGGIVLRYGNTEIDSSVKTKLEKLKKQIDGVIA